MSPKWSTQFTLGNAVSIAVTVFLAGGAFFMAVQVGSNNADDIKDLRAAVATHAIRIGKNEQDLARADERYTAILQTLTRIDNRLARIENRKD